MSLTEDITKDQQDKISTYGRLKDNGHIIYDGIYYQWQIKMPTYHIVGYHICNDKHCSTIGCQIKALYMIDSSTDSKCNLCQNCLKNLELRTKRKIEWRVQPLSPFV